MFRERDGRIQIRTGIASHADERPLGCVRFGFVLRDVVAGLV